MQVVMGLVGAAPTLIVQLLYYNNNNMIILVVTCIRGNSTPRENRFTLDTFFLDDNLHCYINKKLRVSLKLFLTTLKAFVVKMIWKLIINKNSNEF